MRNILMAGAALTVSLIAPAAVADATAERAALDRIERPQVCGPAVSANAGTPVAVLKPELEKVLAAQSKAGTGTASAASSEEAPF